jgi:hypothetical protein
MQSALTESLATITNIKGEKPMVTAQFSVTLTDEKGAPVFQDAESFSFTDIKTAKTTARKIVANAIKLSEKTEGEE